MRLEDIPDLVRPGFGLTDRLYLAHSKSDLFRDAAQSAERSRDNGYLAGYFPLCEAETRLGRLVEARDTLIQLQDRLNRIHPLKNASSEESFPTCRA